MSNFMDNLNAMQDWEPGKSFNDEPERMSEPTMESLPETISIKDWIEMANIDIVAWADSYRPWQGEVRITSEIRPDALFTSQLTFGMKDPEEKEQWGKVLSVFHCGWRELWFLDDYYDSLAHYYMEEGLAQNYSTAKQWQRTIEEQWEDFQEQFGEYLSEAFRRIDHRYGLFEYVKHETTDFIPIFTVVAPHDIDGTYYIGGNGERVYVDEDWHCVHAKLKVENLNGGRYYPYIDIDHTSWRRDENDIGMTSTVRFTKDKDGHYNEWFHHQEPYERTWGSGESYTITPKPCYRVWTPEQLSMFMVFSELNHMDIMGTGKWRAGNQEPVSRLVVQQALMKYTERPWDSAIQLMYNKINSLVVDPTPTTCNRILVQSKIDAIGE